MADPFADFNRPHMARGQFMFRGMAVVVADNVPRKHVGDEIVPVMPNWFVRLFLRLFRRPIFAVRFERGDKIEEEQAFEAQGKLFMSPIMWDALSRSTRSAGGR